MEKEQDEALFIERGTMYQDTYYVDKSTGTFSDSLMAFGAADVIRRLIGNDEDVDIVDAGSVYEIRCARALSATDVEREIPFTCAPFILTLKNRARLPSSALESVSNSNIVIDYEAEKQKRVEFFQLRSALSKDDKNALATLTPPHPSWDVFRAINPGALPAYNSLVSEWWKGRACPEMFHIFLEMLSKTPHDFDVAEKAWTALCQKQGWERSSKATFTQILNPSQGKGQNRSKADSLDMKNISGFWMPEYLKAIGLYQGGITRIIKNPNDPRNAKDRKTYVLAPVHLNWSKHSTTMKEFIQSMTVSDTGLRLDILVTLRYTQAFLNHWAENPRFNPAARLWGHRINEYVLGTQTAYYKNLGNSAAVMNISSLNLPEWVSVNQPDDLAALREVLEEHGNIVRKLEEKFSDQCNLLADYRTFLTGGDWDKFFAFTTAYSGFVIKQRERRKPVKQFTTINLEVMMRNSSRDDFTEIIESPGFQHVAAAIRASTVTPQYYKAKDVKPHYDVRYGLGQELARHANYADNFIAALSDFLRDYNRENEQMRERYKDQFRIKPPISLLRVGVRTGDIDEILRLIAKFGPRVVCNLLVAYGYARVTRDGAQDEEDETATIDAISELTDAVSDEQEEND
jgi:hypothetical protein